MLQDKNEKNKKKRGFTMINMMVKVKEEFPELYTKQGTLTKRGPKKYTCVCGHTFSKTKNKRGMGMTVSIPICETCGKRGKRNLACDIWKRVKSGEIEQEDFILNVVKEREVIELEELETLLSETFATPTNALRTLAYFGYLQIDQRKKEKWNMNEYHIDTSKNLEERYECIR